MTYVRNAWYVAAWAHEIQIGRPLGLRVLNEPIVVWRNAAGDLAALEDRCAHRLAPLSLGRCEGEKLRCMYHGMLYDRGGHVVEIPGEERVPKNMRVRTYVVVERHDWVWVWMGDAAADEALIPPVLGMGNPDYVFGHGKLDYAAEARFVNENLLELSHATFLHAETFRYGETWTLERPKVTQLERSVRSERWIKNEGMLGIVGAEPHVDTYFCYEFYIPGVLMMTYRTYPLGTADALNGQPPDLNEPLMGFTSQQGFTSQAVTPLTEKTARYSYILARRRCGDETAYDMTIAEKAFTEDKTMIEAQQHNVDITPGWRFMATSADRGIVLFNRLVERLEREESTRLSQPSETGL